MALGGLSATGTLTFTTLNWGTAQTVTVTAGEDIDGADDPVTLTHTAGVGDYAGVTAVFAVKVIDNDRMGDDVPLSISFESSTYSATEGGDVNWANQTIWTGDTDARSMGSGVGLLLGSVPSLPSAVTRVCVPGAVSVVGAIGVTPCTYGR